MSVLIRGMKMPKTCMNGGCPIGGEYCDLWWKAGCGSYGRHKDCPLIDLPDHGDLIDRDVLLSKVQKWYWEALETVKRMPTVIPAERSEDATD